MDRLPGIKVGKGGQLQEWLDDWDLEAPEPDHRHVSHLYGLFPSEQITPETPVLYSAARRSLELRGDAGTGWSLAWKINLWARLQDGEHAYALLRRALKSAEAADGSEGETSGVYANLFDSHPPFQIDGNFGAVSGINEMLLQSHRGFIHLLPALPAAWKEGSISGIRARGGYTLSLHWEKGALSKATIESGRKKNCKIVYGSKSTLLKLSPNKPLHLDGNLQIIRKA
jgi:alpha-L-fucosidase 2